MSIFKPRILIDMDSVIYDIITPWIDCYNADYPHAPVQYDDFKEWDMTKAVCAECGVKIFDYLKHYPSVYFDGDIIPGSQEVINNWNAQGYELAVVTSCVGNIAAKCKAEWLDKHFPLTKNRIYMQGNHIKHWLDADIMIDDAPHNLEHFTGFKILFDQPWNQHYNRADVLRVKNWQEIEHAVRTFSLCVVDDNGSFYFYTDEEIISIIKETMHNS
jgi:5'(3')-deoxyribonucleotidase